MWRQSRPFSMTCAAALVCALLSGRLWAQNAKAPAELELKALEARRSIQSLHVVYVGTLTHGSTERYLREVWWDAGKDKQVLRRTMGHAGDYEAVKSELETIIATDDLHIFWSDMAGRPEAAIPVHYRPLTKQSKPSAALTPLDPRVIGMAIGNSFDLCGRELSDVVGNTDRVNTEITDVEWKGGEAKKVSYRSSSGREVQIVFAAAVGWSPVQLQHAGDSQGGRLVYNLDVESFTEVGPGMYFPSHLKFERRVGDKVTRSEEAEVTVVSFNEPIPPEQFTIAGMDLPKGTPVAMAHDKRARHYVWNGSRIVGTVNDDGIAFGRGINGFYITAAILALVGVVAAWLSMRARASSDAP